MSIFARMADNYLEKRYEEVFGNRSVKKVPSGKPSLDTLLSRINSFQQFDLAYKVHPLQLEAILCSAKKPGYSGFYFTCEFSDSIATIHVGTDSNASPVLLGAIIQIISLKAAELGLRTEPRISPELQCSISIGKPACE